MNEILLKIISLGTIGVILFCITYITLSIFHIKTPLQNIIDTYRLHILFIIALMGTCGSLLLTNYFNLEACNLCWYQRMFLFPLSLIAFIAILKKDMHARLYIFSLSLIGFLIAVYHSILQSKFFASDAIFCNPLSAVSCSMPQFTYFGFVTIPVISSAVFLLLLIFSYERKKF